MSCGVMKAYCVDVRGFGLAKKELVFKAISKLSGSKSSTGVGLLNRTEKIVNVGPQLGRVLSCACVGDGELSEVQKQYQISFNDLMLEAGFNYEERGVEDFGEIDIFKGVKITTNKTRPQITREQYDAVMAQSDKRTFTKALDDLLAIEKEQTVEESAIRVSQLEDKCARLNLAIVRQNEQLSANSYTIDQLRGENDRLTKNAEEELGLWVEFDGLNSKRRQSLEKHKRISGVLSLLLISSVAVQLAVIFLGG